MPIPSGTCDLSKCRETTAPFYQRRRRRGSTSAPRVRPGDTRRAGIAPAPRTFDGQIIDRFRRPLRQQVLRDLARRTGRRCKRSNRSALAVLRFPGCRVPQIFREHHQPGGPAEDCLNQETSRPRIKVGEHRGHGIRPGADFLSGPLRHYPALNCDGHRENPELKGRPHEFRHDAMLYVPPTT